MGFLLLLDVVVCFYIVINMCHILQSFIYSLISIFSNTVLTECQALEIEQGSKVIAPALI